MNEELRIIISAEINKLKQELKKGQEELKNTEAQAKTSGNEIGQALTEAGNVAAKATKFIAGAMVAVIGAIVAAVEGTREFRTQQALLSSAFQTAGSNAEVAKEVYNDLYRVLGDTGKATEAAQHLASLTTEQQALSEWTTICQGVYATFGDSLPIESLTEAANETAKTGELTGALADALNWAGVSEEEFKDKLFECNTEAEREALIRQTLSGIYGDAAANYEKVAASVLAENEAQAKLNETMAALGEAAAPVVTMFKQELAEALMAVMPQIQEFAETHLPELIDIIAEIGEIIADVLSWIIDNWEFVSTIAIIIAGISAALAVLTTVMTVVNAVLYASPVTWIVMAIVAAVAALVAIIVLCIKYWDEIKAAGAAAWEWIKKAWNTAATWFNDKIIQPIVNGFTKAWQGIQNIFAKWKAFFKGIVDSVKSVFSGIADWFGNIFSSAWTKVKNVFSAGGKIFDGIKDGILNGLKTIVNGIITGINKVIAIPFNGINSALNKLRDLSILGVEPFGWLPTISVPQIPKLYKGGVLEKGQVGLLEGSGAEAVVPLENNTKWLNEIATRLADMLGTGTDTPIILQIDGKTLARTSIKSINQLTKQTGKLDLILG